MGQPSAQWVAERRAAEAALLDDFHALHDTLVRSDRRITSLDARANALRVMPNGNADALELEAADLRRLVALASLCLTSLDRLHLLHEPARAQRAGSGR